MSGRGEPDEMDVVKEVVATQVARVRTRLVDRAKELLTVPLAAKLAGYLLFSGVGIWSVVEGQLPAIAVFGLIVVGGAAVISALVAHRLLERARNARDYGAIATLRERQRRLEIEDILDLAALALAGDHDARRELIGSRSGGRDVRSALLYYEARVRQKLKEGQPPRALRRSGATPAPPDTKSLQRRRSVRKAQLAEFEGEIQVLADRKSSAVAEMAATLRAERRAAEDRATAAAREARNRRRAGQRATARPGTETNLTLSFAPDGAREVRTSSRATAEELAAGDNSN